jgi:hemolysin activation/secretion protein
LTLDASAAVYPAVWNTKSTFGTLSAVATTFVTLPLPLSPVFAMRAGGQQNFGEAPYFESAFLGGRHSVRTLRRNDFAGDAMVYGTAELRIPIASFPLILPMNTGIFGFADAGRVYLDGKSPGGWNSGMGGGLWLGVLKPSTSVSITFTNQRDRKVMLGTGFVF